MLKRIAVATAIGASMFGLAGVGASSLATGTNNGTVQQSNALTATCQSGLNSTLDFSNVVTKDDVTAARVFQQSVEPKCSGEMLQIALKMNNGAVVYSNKVWIPTSNVTTAQQEAFLLGGSTNLSEFGYAVYGEDLYPQFPQGVCANAVVSTVVTVADQINSPGSNTSSAVDGTLPTCTGHDAFFTNTSKPPAA
ncbi:hypothetical protein GHK86_03050 [Acidimicrobiaceae bacterium USS-CC1]|uniref:Secreted protein n=1 Tax=Acidiferrimicrobium australe TaxID=2664430 RepID=A0ABW9QQT0_9ACTN|nr:hypothetical protein [Acidiferrimicrobium australe]